MNSAIGTRRRTTVIVFATGAFASAGIFAAVTVAPVVAEELTGSRKFVGMPGAAATIGTAVAALALAAVMSKKGRAVGLRLGYAIGTLGFAAAILAIRAGSLLGMLAGMAAAGAGFAAYNLGRFAVAEIYSEERRPQVLGWIVWAATIGALAGPNLPELIEPISASIGLSEHAGGFLAAFAAMGLALVGSLLLRRQPPLGSGETMQREAAPQVTVRSLLHGRVLGAMIAIVGAQAAMVSVMVVTPIHIRDAGHDVSAVGLVMSAHFVGMFALAPVAGRIVGKLGVSGSIVTGFAILIASSLAAGITDGHQAGRVGVALFGLGLGWSLSFVAASSQLAGDLPAVARVRVQGTVDAAAWTTAAVASIVAGVVIESRGYLTLSIAAAALALIAVLAAVTRARPDRA